MIKRPKIALSAPTKWNFKGPWSWDLGIVCFGKKEAPRFAKDKNKFSKDMKLT